MYKKKCSAISSDDIDRLLTNLPNETNYHFTSHLVLDHMIISIIISGVLKMGDLWIIGHHQMTTRIYHGKILD